MGGTNAAGGEITEKAAMLFLELTRAPRSDVNELADAVGESNAETRALLVELADAGLIAQDEPGGPWVPVNPVGPLRKLITEAERAMSAARARRDELSNLEDRLSRAYGFHVERAAEDRAIEVIHGVEAADERLNAIARTGLKEALALLPGPGITGPPEMIEQGVQNELKQLASGMEHRNIVDWPYLSEPAMSSKVQRLAQAGAEYRLSPRPLPIRCIIAPPSLVALPITAEDSGMAGVMIVHASSIVRATAALFELLWAQSARIPTSPDIQPRVDSKFSEDESMLLDYLATGLPDEAIALRLGVSSRTVRRRIGELADRLGATSRFQLALRAASHGWQAAAADDSDRSRSTVAPGGG